MLNSFLAINENKLSEILEEDQYHFICAKAHTQNGYNDMDVVVAILKELCRRL